MHFTTPLLTLLTLTPLALAGTTTITNHCTHPIYLWTTTTSNNPATGSTNTNEPIALGPGASSTAQLLTSPTSLKISNSTSLLTTAHTQFEYVVSASQQLWYDISLVNCAAGQSASNCPGHAGGLKMEAKSGSGKSCGVLACPAGGFCPEQAYYVDYPVQKMGVADPVVACPVGMGVGEGVELVVGVCADQAPTEKRSLAGRLWV